MDFFFFFFFGPAEVISIAPKELEKVLVFIYPAMEERSEKNVYTYAQTSPSHQIPDDLSSISVVKDVKKKVLFLRYGGPFSDSTYLLNASLTNFFCLVWLIQRGIYLQQGKMNG